MSVVLGQTISRLRKERGYTQQELAEKLFCSRELVAKIEAGTRSLSEECIIKLSIILDFNFAYYKSHSHNYRNLEHYNIVHKLIDLQRVGDYQEIESILQNNDAIDELNYGYPFIIREYCRSLVLVNINNDYSSARIILLNALKIPNSKDIIYFEPSYDGEGRYFSCILLLSLVLCVEKKLSLSLVLIKNTITFLQENYFDDIFSQSEVPQYYKHVYIALLNNQADILYNQKKYNDALLVCDKINKIMNESDSYYSLEYVLKLKVQILYKQKLITLSQGAYDEFKIICRLKNSVEYFYSTNDYFIKEFPLIQTSALE